VAAALAEASGGLVQRGSPRLDAEILLAHALDVRRTDVLARLSERLPSDAARRFEHLVARRAAGEPTAYLTGFAPFYDLDLEVSPAVLVPRPETESLVDWALRSLGRRWPGAVVLDVGTGSGAIALALARHSPVSLDLHATDASAAALALARRNARRVGLDGVVRFHQADLLPAAPARFDLVVANLPYVADEDPDLAADVCRWEPPEALFGGSDGLAEIRRLLDVLPSRLAHGAGVGLEVGAGQAAAVARLLGAALPGAALSVHVDLAGHQRVVAACLA
jgi:release factor glutamine methyltransferase